MIEVQKAHAEYWAQINKIRESNEEIGKVADAIQGLQNQVSKAKEIIVVVNDKLLTAAVDMANGSLSSDEYMLLKKEVREQEGVIEDLTEIISMQGEVKGRLIGSSSQIENTKRTQKEMALGIEPVETLRVKNSKLSFLKATLINALTKQAVGKVALVAKDEIKELSFLMASAEKFKPAHSSLGGDLYSDLGKALCLSVFDAKEEADYPDVTFQQARNECEVIIEDLNTYTLATK